MRCEERNAGALAVTAGNLCQGQMIQNSPALMQEGGKREAAQR